MPQNFSRKFCVYLAKAYGFLILTTFYSLLFLGGEREERVCVCKCMQAGKGRERKGERER